MKQLYCCELKEGNKPEYLKNRFERDTTYPMACYIEYAAVGPKARIEKRLREIQALFAGSQYEEMLENAKVRPLTQAEEEQYKKAKARDAEWRDGVSRRANINIEIEDGVLRFYTKKNLNKADRAFIKFMEAHGYTAHSGNQGIQFAIRVGAKK